MKLLPYLVYLIIIQQLMACQEFKDHPPRKSKAVGKLEGKDYTQWVDPFIGTDGTGHTFPGPSWPMALVQPGPDNRDIGWDYTSGYQFQDRQILGFSHSRASGTGINEFGDVLLLPLGEDKTKHKSKKEEESAEVGLYEVRLDNGVNVSLTSTPRVGIHRYEFPSEEATVYVNLQHGLRFLTDSLVLESQVKLEGNHAISGYARTKNWVERRYFFYIEFDQKWQQIEQKQKEPKEVAPKYLIHFKLGDGKLMAKVALSGVSVKGAKANMKTEAPDWQFESYVLQAKKRWNKLLSKIEIEADDDQKTIFYTALYHLYLQPANIADANGQYRGADHKVRKAPAGKYYSTLSLWDTYRAAHPLYTLLSPDLVNGFINSMLLHADAQGYLPIWTAWGQENHCMIGNHAIPVITDAYMKGFSGFDEDKALEAMLRSTRENHLNSDWEIYNQYGYYPFDLLDNESVSRTLESGLDDYCVAIFAQEMEEESIARSYFKRSEYYKNLFDPETKLMRGKDSEGNFRSPFDPITSTSPMNNPGDYTEANAWQYSWASAQYDVAGLIKLMGGKAAFTRQLNTFFSLKGEENKHLGQEGMIGQYAHGNEPGHHIPYLYAYSDSPEKGQDLLRTICRDFYSSTPSGITGNEDCGQMSAWYIFTTLGFYPVNPANGTFVLGVPQVARATVKLPKGKQLLIRNNHLQDGSEVKAVFFNGQKVEGPEIRYQDLMKGGELVFE
ncbi:GH92 family glycosyl hydrolase [Persicobacter diffluens]